MEKLSFDHLSDYKNGAGTEADLILLSLKDLDALGDGIGTRLRNTLDDGSVMGDSILKVQGKVLAILSEKGIRFSQVFIEKGEFAGSTLDKVFSK